MNAQSPGFIVHVEYIGLNNTVDPSDHLRQNLFILPRKYTFRIQVESDDPMTVVSCATNAPDTIFYESSFLLARLYFNIRAAAIRHHFFSESKIVYHRHGNNCL